MLFNSIPFIFFFVIVVSFYFALPRRLRWIMLLASSYYFYMCWKAEYVFLILLTTTIDYVVAQKIAASQVEKRRRRYLLLSLVSNLTILFGFKYFNFVSESVAGSLSLFNIFIDVPVFHALLPVGISFYTFQSLSYVIDVYRKKTSPESHFGYYALYVSFWPQLVAGPIERSWHLLPQLRQHHLFEVERVTSGLRLMLAGLFKKVVIADQVAIFVNRAYNNANDQPGAVLMLATLFFAVQIYCDFSGYTDVARGAARVMGYDLMENFRTPYLATSIHDFWRRWHISLSTWFRDYVYIPLGGNKLGILRWNMNLFITFFISGLWHGANWTFVVWGVLHGCYLIVENFCTQATQKLSIQVSKGSEKMIVAGRILLTFFFVCLAWVFFRAASISDAFHIIVAISSTTFSEVVTLAERADVMLPVFLTIVLFTMDGASRTRPLEDTVAALPQPLRWLLYTAAFWAIVVSAVFGVQQQFIYFQF